MIKKFTVSGMSCSACSSGIERAVKNLDGVNTVSVSLLTKEMTVDFDEIKLSESRIEATVIKLGYGIVKNNQISVDKYSDAKRMKKRFIISLIILIPLIYLCMGNMVNLPVPKATINFPLQAVLSTVILILNRKFFINGTKAVLHGLPNMDTLVSLGSASAFVYSLVITVMAFTSGNASSHTFFDSSAMVVTLVTLGKWLEELSKIKTGDAIEKLGNLLPKTVTLIKDGKQSVILTEELNVGDTILVKAGEYVPIDGEVIEGNAGVDKSAITGESMPEEVSVGSKISSGCIVKEGYLIICAKKVGEQTLFAKIVQIVKTAGTSKAPIQKFADKVAGVFVPVVTALAIITFCVWILVTGELYSAFNYGISVLVISCPCALGLATPVAVLAATGRAAGEGVLFKNAEALQNMSNINCVLLDKTATLTVGKPKVTEYINFTGESDSTVFPIVSALEQKSSHPLADCIVNHCGKTDKTAQNYQYVVGKGIVAEVDGIRYYVGNEELIPKGLTVPQLPKTFEAQTVLYFADDYQVISAFALSDYLKEDSKEAVESLSKSGIKTVMITGDNKAVAKKIAEQVEIDEFEAEVLPEDKLESVKKYKNKGYFVAMVGDGINDSPALMNADVGVAMGTGTDVAIDSADVVVVNGNLSAITKAVEISKKTNRIIKQNLFWAFFYNSIGIPVAGGGLFFVGITLTPAIASALMCISSLFVVTNALRISKRKNKVKADGENFAEENLIEKIITIEGMTCLHCVSKVTDALSKIKGVYKVNVDLKSKKATLIINENVAFDKLHSAVSEAGFTALDNYSVIEK